MMIIDINLIEILLIYLAILATLGVWIKIWQLWFMRKV